MVKKFKTKNRLVQPFLEKTFGEVEKLSEVSSEITFMIPKDKRNMFQQFFQSFDKRMDELGIKSYGISITTLEEVFIAVNAEDRGLNGGDATPLIIGAEENPDEVAMDDYEDAPDFKADNYESRGTLNHVSHHQSEVVQAPPNLLHGSDIVTSNYALLVKRAQIYKRDNCGLVCELFCPFIMVMIGCLFAQIQFLFPSPPRYLIPE